MEIVISIKNCCECPHFGISDVRTTDGWDRGEDWHCKKEDKQIAGFVEWRDNVKIPEWCPILLNKQNDGK